MFTINAKIVDQDTNEPLQFATALVTNPDGTARPINGNSVVGRKTDLDGNFILPFADTTAWLTISYVGYETQTLPAYYHREDTVFKMKKKVGMLNEVIIKANRIFPNKITASIHNEIKGKHFPFTIIIVAAALLGVGFIIYKLIKK